MTVTPREIRDAMGCFATGITVITALDADGRHVGLTANSFNSVSLDPPLVLFSLDRRANCVDAFRTDLGFAVNVLGEEQQAVSNHFASKADDKFADLEFDWQVGGNGCALLDGAIASFECVTDALHDGGDHVIVVGRVTRLNRVEGASPLLYFQGQYAGLEG
ncbi:MAG: flavin reductase family protein [Minwuia sp.]|nr:flavin reductase family protein [Minwuia sp.]